MYHLSSGLHGFWRKSIDNIIEDPLYVLILSLLSRFRLWLRNLIRCFTVGLFEFILLRSHWVSWICKFTSFFKFESFHPLILQIIFLFFYLFSLSLTLICWSTWWCSIGLLGLSPFFICFLPAPQTCHFNLLIFKSVDSFFCLIK